MTFDLDVAYPGMGLPAFWKSLFPNWPDELINKYSQGISIDAPKFGFAGGGDISGFQAWWGAVVSPPAQATYSKPMPAFGGDVNININLLNPTNQRFAHTSRWDYPFWYGVNLPISMWDTPPQNLYTNMNGAFMGAIFGTYNATLHAYINFDTRLYYDLFQWNYSTYGTLAGVDVSFFGGRTASYTSVLNVAPNASATPYQFVDTILALHENQADNGGLDYGLLYEYQTFRDAYLKYSQQIDSNTQLVKSQSQAAVNAYRQDYNDRAQREKNDLASKKLQILQAIDNQKQTTLQNYQTQLLTAQNLKLTLNQVLHNG